MMRTTILRGLTAAAALALVMPAHALPAHAAGVTVPDADFRSCLSAALGQGPTAPISAAHLAGLTALDCAPEDGPAGIADLTGAEYLTGLTSLGLVGHRVQDLSPLKDLDSLRVLHLDRNRVRDVSPLAGLVGLRAIDLSGNRVTDASGLAPLTARGTAVDLASQSTAVSVPTGRAMVLPRVRDSRGTPVDFNQCLRDDYADVPADCSEGIVVGGDASTFTPAAPGYHALLAEGAGPDSYSLALEVTAGPVPEFTDVPLDHVFSTEVSWLAGQGIATGYADGRFGPRDAVTRGQFAAFLYRRAGEPEFPVPTRSPFSDVATDHHFFRAITWLHHRGIATGYPGGRYGIGDTVTRGQAAAFLHRSEDSPTDRPLPTVSPFHDVPTDHGFYRPITWLGAEGIARGYTTGYFGLGDPVTRGQAAAFLYRLTHRDGS